MQYIIHSINTLFTHLLQARICLSMTLVGADVGDFVGIGEGDLVGTFVGVLVGAGVSHV